MSPVMRAWIQTRVKSCLDSVVNLGSTYARKDIASFSVLLGKKFGDMAVICKKCIFPL